MGRRVSPSQRNGVRCSLKRFNLELVKPAGLHFVEESSAWQICSTRKFPSNTRFNRPIHVFSRPIHVFPVHHTSFPVHWPTIRKLVKLRWDMLAGYVREWVQELQATECYRIRIKMKWWKLSWKRRLRRKWQAGPLGHFKTGPCSQNCAILFSIADFFSIYTEISSKIKFAQRWSDEGAGISYTFLIALDGSLPNNQFTCVLKLMVFTAADGCFLWVKKATSI